MSGRNNITQGSGDVVVDEFQPMGVDANCCGVGAEGEDGSGEDSLVIFCCRRRDSRDGGGDDAASPCKLGKTKLDTCSCNCLVGRG